MKAVTSHNRQCSACYPQPFNLHLIATNYIWRMLNETDTFCAGYDICMCNDFVIAAADGGHDFF